MKELNNTALWNAGSKKDKIIVISDLHVGVDDSFAENVKNREYLVEFFSRIEKTSDIREVVIGGDFLDEWILPMDYPVYTDSTEFYRRVVKNNQIVLDAMKHLVESGVKLVYVYGNHDMLMDQSILKEAVPGIEIACDTKGLGRYRTGDRDEIVVEHGHRYCAFASPDTLTNADLCKQPTTLPSGYIYARYGTSWFVEGRPSVKKSFEEIKEIPDRSDIDQLGAYTYHKIVDGVTKTFTPLEGEDEKVFHLHIDGFDDDYSYRDYYPTKLEDGTISAPVLYKNIQRTWDKRQDLNHVRVKNTFLEAAKGALDNDYYCQQAQTQYFDDPDQNTDVVVFGHMHIPYFKTFKNGKIYINDGTWVDNNISYPEATRTFAVITTGETTTADLMKYDEDGTPTSIKESVLRES